MDKLWISPYEPYVLGLSLWPRALGHPHRCVSAGRVMMHTLAPYSLRGVGAARQEGQAPGTRPGSATAVATGRLIAAVDRLARGCAATGCASTGCLGLFWKPVKGSIAAAIVVRFFEAFSPANHSYTRA